MRRCVLKEGGGASAGNSVNLQLNLCQLEEGPVWRKGSHPGFLTNNSNPAKKKQTNIR